MLRNNPKFKASIGDSTYVDRVAEVAQNLEERIHEIEADKERIRIANEISKLLELERLEKERQTRLAAIRARYTEELAVTFKLWISSLWRKEGGNLFKQEIVLDCVWNDIDIIGVSTSNSWRFSWPTD